MRQIIIKNLNIAIGLAKEMKNSNLPKNFFVYIGEIRALESLLPVNNKERAEARKERINLQAGRTYF